MTEEGRSYVDPCTTTQRTRDVLCPFFIAHGLHEIHCEAYDDACKMVMRYRCKANKDIQMQTFCCGRYTYCEHYRGLVREKYEEE